MRFVRGSGSVVILLAFLLIVAAAFALASDVFFSPANLRNILLQATAAAIAAAGLTYVIVLSDIDLSIGSTMNLSVVAAIVLTSSGSQFDLISTPWAIPVALTVGLLCGLANAVLINVLQINALIVTLGTTSVFLGISLTITQASTLVVGGNLPEIIGHQILGVPTVLAAGLGLTALLAYVLQFRRTGRLLLAVGGDPRSAAESGLSRSKARFVAFAATGVCAAAAGLVTVGQVGSVSANLGSDFAFTVITAVVIGGTSLFGGRGSVWGSVIGAILLSTIENGLNAVNASSYAYDVVRGAVLILAMLADAISERMSLRRLLRSSSPSSSVSRVGKLSEGVGK